MPRSSLYHHSQRMRRPISDSPSLPWWQTKQLSPRWIHLTVHLGSRTICLVPWLSFEYDAILPLIEKTTFPDASALIGRDAPGYQIGYSAVTNEDPVMNVRDDCQIYGMAYAGPGNLRETGWKGFHRGYVNLLWSWDIVDCSRECLSKWNSFCLFLFKQHWLDGQHPFEQ